MTGSPVLVLRAIGQALASERQNGRTNLLFGRRDHVRKAQRNGGSKLDRVSIGDSVVRGQVFLRELSGSSQRIRSSKLA